MSNKRNQQNIDISEKEVISNRTLPGRLAAKRMGKLGGRPKKLNAEKIALARKLYDDRSNSVESICKVLGISKPCFYAYLYDRHTKSWVSHWKYINFIMQKSGNYM